MNRILLICESKKDAKHLVETIDTLPYPLEKIDILSMQPEIKSILSSQHISSMSSTDFIYHEDYEVINIDCEKIYLELETITGQNNLNCFSKCFENMFLYYAFFAYYTITWNARLLQNLLGLNQYDIIITIPPHKNLNTSPWFIASQNILHILLSQVFVDKKFEHVILKSPECKKIKFGSSMFLSVVRRSIRPSYKWLLKTISDKDKNTAIIIVPTTGKNIGNLCSDLEKKHSNILFFSFGEGKSIIAEIYKLYILLKYLIFKKRSYDPNLSEGNVVRISLSLLTPVEVREESRVSFGSFNKAILALKVSKLKLKILNAKELSSIFQQNKFQHILSYLEYQKSLSLGLEKFLELSKPDMILSQMSLGVSYMLGYLAETARIPSMLISHGSHVLHTEGVAKLEHELIANNMLIGPYRFLGIQTVLSKEYVAKKQIPDRSIIKIKPTTLSNNISKRKIQDAKLTVLHAGSVKDGTNRHIYETPDELLETFQETIDILSTCQNIQLIIKFRQINAFSFQALKNLLGPLPDNVSLVNGGIIGDFFASSHLLMSFSSTTIEEALINDTPVLLYGGKGRYSHIPTDPFKPDVENSIMKPVIFVNNRKSLTDYFKILNKNYLQFIGYKFDFDRFRFKDSVEVTCWLEQNRIFNKTYEH